MNNIYEKGDYIEFKNFSTSMINNDVLRGKIIDSSNPDLLEVLQINTPDNTCHYPGHYNSGGYNSCSYPMGNNNNNNNYRDNNNYHSNNYNGNYNNYSDGNYGSYEDDDNADPIIEYENCVVWISPSSIVKHYPPSSVKHLSPRLLLKEKWKNFIFREVKT